MPDNLDGNIMGYTIQYQRVAVDNTEQIDIEVPETEHCVEHTIDTLLAEGNFYVVKVT